MIGRCLSTTTLVVLGLLVPAAATSAQGFEAEYESLVDRFSVSLDAEAAVDRLVEEAGDLTDRVRQHRRDNRDSLSDEELDRLRDLANEVRAFESVTRVVGQKSNAADVSHRL